MHGRSHDALTLQDPGQPGPPTVLYVVGARPNFVKMAPVVCAMRDRAPEWRHVLVHTGQHYDAEMSAIFFEELGLPAPDRLLGVGSGSHGAQTARALERLEAVFEELRPSAVVVPGDVNSTLAAALAAAKLDIPIAHIEAGLRSFDRSMPEELNRLLVDQLSRWCFIHSPEAATNLAREGIEEERVQFVGNTMIDTLVGLRAHIDSSAIHAELGLERRGYLLVTLHRPALVDGPLFDSVMSALAEVAEEMPVIFPMHPRTRARLSVERGLPSELRIVDPIGYVDFLALESLAGGVLTDSGGVQEETTFLRVPCFTLRDNTERPVTITHGSNRLLGLRPQAVTQIPAWLADDTVNADVLPHGWDGMASTRVADVLVSELGERLRGAPTDTESLALDAAT